jgi:aryl-phospho-beta-D-glucosidase BglC (GH1 family)
LALCVVAPLTPSGALAKEDTGRNAQRITGRLHTRGGLILDQRGRSVRFLGLGLVQLAPGSGEPSKVQCMGWQDSPEALYDNVKKWGFNSVRLAISWANVEPDRPIWLTPELNHHFWNWDYLAAVDRAVESLTSRGIAVILEMSQNKWSPYFSRSELDGNCPGRGMPAWLYEGTTIDTINEAKVAFFENRFDVQQMFAQAWQTVVRRYRDNPLVVGADILNEPYIHAKVMPPERMQLDWFYRRIGNAIRAVDPRLLLIFQDNQEDELRSFALTEPPPFPNVVYSYHLYELSWGNDGRSRMEKFHRRARQWGIPGFLGEFNAFRYASNGLEPQKNWLASLDKLMSFCKEKGIGWMFWAYSGGNSIVKPGTHTPKPDLLPALQRGF